MKTILITGATGGIGMALAEAYAANNIRLILTGRNQEKLATLSQLCENKNAAVITYPLDLKNQLDTKAWVTEINKQYPIDLVIANAGVSATIAANGAIESYEVTKTVFDVNLYGVLACITPLIESMKQRQSGQIAIVSSLAAYRGLPQSPAYCGSKAAIKVYGESLRAHLSRFNVKVSVVCPGFVKSPMSDALKGPKPFMLSTEKAAKIIKKGLEKNKGRIAFPKALSIPTLLATLLPIGLTDYILQKIQVLKES